MSAFHRLGRGEGGGRGGTGRRGKERQIFEEIGIVSPLRKESGKIRGDYNKRLDRGWRPPRRRRGKEKRKGSRGDERIRKK
jgi:hypothetical protein